MKWNENLENVLSFMYFVFHRYLWIFLIVAVFEVIFFLKYFESNLSLFGLLDEFSLFYYGEERGRGKRDSEASYEGSLVGFKLPVEGKLDFFLLPSVSLPCGFAFRRQRDDESRRPGNMKPRWKVCFVLERNIRRECCLNNVFQRASKVKLHVSDFRETRTNPLFTNSPYSYLESAIYMCVCVCVCVCVYKVANDIFPFSLFQVSWNIPLYQSSFHTSNT